MRKQMRWAQKQQAKLCTDVAEARSKGSKGKKKEKVWLPPASLPKGLTEAYTPHVWLAGRCGQGLL